MIIIKEKHSSSFITSRRNKQKKNRHYLFQSSPKLRCIAEPLGLIRQHSGKIGNGDSKLLIDLITRNTTR